MIAVIEAFGKALRTSERMGVAMTKSPIQLGMRMMIFLGSMCLIDFMNSS